MRRRCRWKGRRKINLSFRDGALAPDPESRDSGLASSRRPGMTATPSALLCYRGIDAVRPAARRRKVKADEAEQDRGCAVVDQREEAARKMSAEIGQPHFAPPKER